MMESDVLRFVKDEIKRQVNIILSGAAGLNSQVINEDIQDLYPGMPTIENRPVMHPYGFVSRATNRTLQVTAKQGDHPGNRLILGHRDSLRPTTINEGESLIYSSDGQTVLAVVHATSEGDILIKDAVDSETTRAEFKSDGTVNLGAEASHAVGLADIILARIEAVEDKLNSFINSESGHTHVITTAPGTSGPGPVVTPLSPDTTALGSSKVNVAT